MAEASNRTCSGHGDPRIAPGLLGLALGSAALAGSGTTHASESCSMAELGVLAGVVVGTAAFAVTTFAAPGVVVGADSTGAARYWA